MKYIFRNGHWTERNEEMTTGHMVQGEIEPYQSMVDGTIIESRSQHREHLKRHGCYEVGNDIQQPKPLPDVAPQQRHEIIRAQVNAMRHDEFKKVLKRDLDRVRWNSRED